MSPHAIFYFLLRSVGQAHAGNHPAYMRVERHLQSFQGRKILEDTRWQGGEGVGIQSPFILFGVEGARRVEQRDDKLARKHALLPCYRELREVHDLLAQGRTRG